MLHPRRLTRHRVPLRRTMPPRARGVQMQQSGSWAIGRREQGQGAALKPARGLCPLDPHQRRRPLESIHFGCGEGGAVRDWPGPPGSSRRLPALSRPPRPIPHCPSLTATKEWVPRAPPLVGIQGAEPLGGVQGQSPWPCFLRPIALASGPGESGEGFQAVSKLTRKLSSQDAALRLPRRDCFAADLLRRLRAMCFMVVKLAGA